MAWLTITERIYWINRLIEISNEMDESESMISVTSRLQISKSSPPDSWTISYEQDTNINENNFQNEILINKMLEDQKTARQVAKIGERKIKKRL
jgi:hypothetical protein